MLERVQNWWRGDTAALREARRRLAEVSQEHPYHAFISFSGNDERILARRLRRALRSVAGGWLGRHRVRVFLDEAGLAAGAQISGTLRKHLDSSARLVLVASKASAGSPWVQQELTHWLDTRTEPVLLAYASDTLLWLPHAGDFDWQQTDALPGAILAGKYPTQPIWADLRKARGYRVRRSATIHEAAAKLAAGIINVSPEALWRSERYRRRNRYLAVVATVAIVLVTATTAILASQDASRSGAIAEANQLTTVADQLRAGEPSLAAQFDAAAYARYPTPTAYTNLLNDENTPLFTAVPQAAAVSPDGRTALVGNPGDDALRVRSLVDSRPAGSIGPLPKSTPDRAAAFAPDSHLVAVTAPNAVVRLWEVTDPSRPANVSSISDSPNVVSTIDFSPDGQTVVIARTNGTTRLWSLANPAHPAALGPAFASSTDSPVTALVFGRGGHRLTAGQADGSVDVWDITDPTHPTRTGQPVPGTPGQSTRVVATFGPGGDSVVITTPYAETFRWQLDNVSIYNPAGPTHLDLGGTAVSSALSPDGLTLAVHDGDDRLTLWNMADRSDPIPLGPALTMPKSVTDEAPYLSALPGSAPVFSPDGNRLFDRGLVWHLPSTYRVNGGMGAGGSAGPAHGLLAAGQSDGVASLWTLTAPPGLTRLTGPNASNGITISADGRTLAAASNNGTELWHLNGTATPTRLKLGEPLANQREVVSGMGIGALALNSKGTTLAVSGPDNLIVWNVTDPQHPRQLGTPLPAVGDSLAFNPADDTLATGTSGVIRLWKVAGSGLTPVGTLSGATGPGALMFTPDGRYLAASGANSGVDLWRLTNPTALAHIGNGAGGGRNYDAIALSQDGKRLAITANDGKVRLWDLTTPAKPVLVGQPLTASVTTVDRYLVHRRYVVGIRAVGFGADDNTLGVANADGTIRIWDLNPARTIARVCAATGATLTRAVWQRYARGLAYRAPCRQTLPALETAAPPTTVPAPSGGPATSAASPGATGPASAGGSTLPGQPCTAAMLTIAYGPTTDGLGDKVVPLVLTNTSAAPCILFGDPVVSMHGPQYQDLGDTYRLRSAPTPVPPSVTVTPGGHAHVVLTYLVADAGEDPAWTPDHVLLALPASGGILSLPWPSHEAVPRQDTASLPGTFTSTFLPSDH